MRSASSRRRLRRASLCLLLVSFAAAEARAGAYVFANETNPDRVAHPTGYAGSGGTVSVSVCIDPTSAHASEMVAPVQAVVATWNGQVPTTQNLKFGPNNDVPIGFLDWESVALHEVGHCIGLAHPNLASESGLMGNDTNFTRAGDGPNDLWDIDDGADDVIGSADDLRGDDVNLHWFRTSNNNPFTLASTVDSTTYSRDLSDLPGSDTFPANADRTVAATLSALDTEAVMQQLTFFDEAQRTLGHDDVATLLYAASGVDELDGTADDYSVVLTYAGLTTSCDVVIDFDDSETGFAVCGVSGTFIGADHIAITNADIYFNDGFNWFFGTTCGDSVVDAGEDCDDGNTSDGDCCSATCAFESIGSICDDGVSCTDSDQCDGAGVCAGSANDANCDNGAFCDGTETCDASLDCQSGTPPAIDDGVACTDDSCDEVNDVVVNAPNDANCDNGAFCDGMETCDASLDCQAGAPVPIDDGVACTDDSCDEVNDVVVNAPNDANCDNGTFCDGAETCDASLDCQAGAPVPIDDGVACTDDSCDEVNDVVVNAPNDANCDNGLYCDGMEVCDNLLDCQMGLAPPVDDMVTCTDDSCDEVNDVVVNAPNDSNCDDDNPCTADSCDAVLGCVHDPLAGCPTSVPTISPWAIAWLGVLLAAAAAMALLAVPTRGRSSL